MVTPMAASFIASVLKEDKILAGLLWKNEK
jgi:hypothetical protein